MKQMSEIYQYNPSSLIEFKLSGSSNPYTVTIVDATDTRWNNFPAGSIIRFNNSDSTITGLGRICKQYGVNYLQIITTIPATIINISLFTEPIPVSQILHGNKLMTLKDITDFYKNSNQGSGISYYLNQPKGTKVYTEEAKDNREVLLSANDCTQLKRSMKAVDMFYTNEKAITIGTSATPIFYIKKSVIKEGLQTGFQKSKDITYRAITHDDKNYLDFTVSICFDDDADVKKFLFNVTNHSLCSNDMELIIENYTVSAQQDEDYFRFSLRANEATKFVNVKAYVDNIDLIYINIASNSSSYIGDPILFGPDNESVVKLSSNLISISSGGQIKMFDEKALLIANTDLKTLTKHITYYATTTQIAQSIVGSPTTYPFTLVLYPNNIYVVYDIQKKFFVGFKDGNTLTWKEYTIPTTMSADSITESATRVFVSPAEKTAIGNHTTAISTLQQNITTLNGKFMPALWQTIQVYNTREYTSEDATYNALKFGDGVIRWTIHQKFMSQTPDESLSVIDQAILRNANLSQLGIIIQNPVEQFLYSAHKKLIIANPTGNLSCSCSINFYDGTQFTMVKFNDNDSNSETRISSFEVSGSQVIFTMQLKRYRVKVFDISFDSNKSIIIDVINYMLTEQE